MTAKQGAPPAGPVCGAVGVVLGAGAGLYLEYKGLQALNNYIHRSDNNEATPQSNPTPGTQAGTQPGSEPKDVYLDPNKYPASAAHADAAQKAGQPDVVTVDHDKASATDRRSKALQGIPTQSGKDRDEYPPASSKEGGSNASVQRIPSSDNRGWGGSWGQQTKEVPSGGKVKINIKPKPDSE